MNTTSADIPAQSEPNITAALVSVGSSPEPILHVLRLYRPAHVWYFCSPTSRPQADQIHASLEWHPDRDIVEVERFEELGPCYLALRKAIPELLKKWRVPPEQVLVDYTGGTKTMSAALVLAAIEHFQHFSYVGGEQREKGGLGVVIGGKEKAHIQANPWAQLAIREVERARDLWNACEFEAAARVLREVAPRVPAQQRFHAFAELAEGMAARHRLDFSEAISRLHAALGRLRLMFEGKPVSPLPLIQSTLKLCETCKENTVTLVLLRELLDNTLRTARQGRYEDAAARLYRAMEMQGQIWLAEATGGLFINGKCKAENLPRLPEQLQNSDFCKPDRHGEIKLGLEDVFRALAALGHERARAIVADIDAKDASGKPASRWRAATEKRNAGILAHGVSPVGKDGFEEMKRIASEFLGFDLENEANPIPPLDPRWFEIETE